MNTKVKSWTKKELEYLKKNYSQNNIEKMCKDLGRSKNAIKLKANRLGLKVKLASNRRYWTNKEIQYLDKYWGKVDLEIMCEKLNRSKYSIYQKAMRRLGIMKEQEYTSSDLARALNVNTSTIQQYKRIGLKSKKLKRYSFINIQDFWRFAKEHKKTVKFYRFKKNDIPNEPAWVDEERKKQFSELGENQGKEWTNYEDIILTNLVKRGKKNKEIAKEMKRSINAIYNRKAVLNINFIMDIERNKNAV